MRTGVQEQIALIFSNDLGLSASQNCLNFFPKTARNLTVEMNQISTIIPHGFSRPNFCTNCNQDLSIIGINQSLQIALNKNQYSYLLFAPKSIINKLVSVFLNGIIANTITKQIKISN